jgi:holo-[acyl-carrier protein] synthase
VIEPPAAPRGTRVVAVGIDLVDIGRIRAARARSARFDQRVFTAGELDAIRGAAGADGFLARCFAVKEAVGKALGTGISGLELTSVGLTGTCGGVDVDDDDDVVEVVVEGRAARAAAALGIEGWWARVGVVGDGSTAIAVVVGVCDQRGCTTS